ncbi:MFS transporter [Microbacterium testaceum]|uniref:MFS transporter n=1 Tax=Microbacterium testaceum TaxID=2033 RepID=UPI002AC44C80|nr:MFS transporter [Microbacterium testaceum]MDZ5145675.1 MFS transporter [Microbacterium testaceum]
MDEDSPSAAPPREILRHPAFAFFWTATTLRAFGSTIAGVAFQVLIVTVIGATPGQVGILNALSVVPYLFLGLVVGAWMDRWRRQRALVVTTIGRAVVLAIVPVFVLAGALDFWSLAAITLVLGVLTLFGDSAAQPLLPRLVPRASLPAANARLGQSQTVAQTAGPAIGGALLAIVGAPILLAIDAVIAAVAALLQSRIVVPEKRAAPRAAGRHVGHEIAQGMRYTYRHPTLRPLALSIHVWFLGNSIVVTAFVVFALRELALPPWAYGVALALGGVGGFVGAVIAPRLGARLGVGRAILLGRVLVVLPWAALALVPLGPDSGIGVTLGVVAAAQFVYGLAMGIEDTNDISYRQSVAPDGIQGRMNSTIRTVNRSVFFVGALLAGLLMTVTGLSATLGVGVGFFAVAALVIACSPLRGARHGGSRRRR